MTSDQIMRDRVTLYPGDVVTASPGVGPSVMVYGLGLWHIFNVSPLASAVSTAIDIADAPPPSPPIAEAFPVMTTPPRPGDFVSSPTPLPPSAEVRYAARLEAVAAAVLADEVFPHFAGCCLPPLVDPRSPLAAAAAESFARQTVEPDEDVVRRRRRRRTTDDDDMPSMAFTYRWLVSSLVQAGHRLADVLHVQQPGILGKLVPYPGYSTLQAASFAVEVSRERRRARAANVNDLSASIAATFGDDDARESTKQYIRDLLSE